MSSLLLADARSIPLDDKTVQCIITSPPYWGLRDYGLLDGIGLEPTLDGYLENMRAVGRELWRVLRDDGTLWLNLGDCYSGSGGENANTGLGMNTAETHGLYRKNPRKNTGLKPKDLVGLPWRVAFELQADGWYLRSDIIWAKPNPMPESVRDRPTRSHEYLFLMSKAKSYYYDAEAIAEPGTGRETFGNWPGKTDNNGDQNDGGRRDPTPTTTRNRRTVWTIPTQPYRGAHFATFPEKLVEPCILAGTSPKACGVCGAPWERVVKVTAKGYASHDGSARAVAMGHSATGPTSRGAITPDQTETIGWRPTCDHNDDTGKCLVLDPFCGSGTVGVMAQKHGRRFVGLDLQPKYLELAQDRIRKAPVGLGL